MGRKILLLFILIFIIGTGSVFGATTDLMTEKIAQDILDYYSNPEHITQTENSSDIESIESIKNNILANYSNITAENFANIYNTYFVPGIEALDVDEHISFNNISIYSSVSPSFSTSYLNLRFVISNNTVSNVLGYTQIDKESNDIFLWRKDGYIYGSTMLINSEGNIVTGANTGKFSTFNVRFYPGLEPTFSSNDEKIFINFQLALSPIQSIYYTDNNKYYFVGNYINAHGEINSGDIESGDVESGDTGGGSTTPSGDTGGGTPDYTEQLGNINNNISSSTNQIIENQNQNQAQTNEKLDNITNFLSGDITKTPEELEENLNIEIEIEDPTADFFTWFFNQIVECFNVNSNQILNFSILDKNFSINTDDYIFDIPILKNVIGIGSSIFIFYGIFQDIRREIEKIKEGKFEAIASEDITANMM